ncbi:MAG TPA: cyclopropane-fatty-acyl-phospholipid synthase family protein [Bryobacteraceae bacterium]|nr:cyclopropane-fatty-acyl-phospholipid synthase family protein [Bryobacteraceae bacterium]
MQASDFSLPEHADGPGKFSRLERWLAPLVFSEVGPAPMRIVLGNGQGVTPPGVIPRFTVRIRDLRTLMELLLDPEIGFGDAWTEGRIQVTGDLVAFLEAVYASMASAGPSATWYARLVSKWIEFHQANTLEGSRRNIHSHYDIGNDFYRLWLDSQLVYTCAYFPSATATLEEAQNAKLDLVCRKLRLQPGETVVEAGCGWGALALHMARNYGVRVKAFNVSREQIRYARERARQENLHDRVEFVEDDYRNMSGKADVFVSVGMLEHVGAENYTGLGSLIHQVVGDRGRGFLHFIGRSQRGDFSRWIRKRIFPGAHAPSLAESLQVLEPFGYFVHDVEDLRPHYARTLEHWLDRFDKAATQVTGMYGPEFERAWRLYLAGSIAGFRVGTLQLFQIVFAGAKFGSMPWTRADLYRPQEALPEWTPATS